MLFENRWRVSIGLSLRLINRAFGLVKLLFSTSTIVHEEELWSLTIWLARWVWFQILGCYICSIHTLLIWFNFETLTTLVVSINCRLRFFISWETIWIHNIAWLNWSILFGWISLVTASRLESIYSSTWLRLHWTTKLVWLTRRSCVPIEA